MQTHSIEVPRTAHYVSLGPAPGPSVAGPVQQTPVCEIWMACHGYGQLARYFGRHFRAVQSPGRLVIVPEGLSRFYLDGPEAGDTYERVGASWMTRADREAEIADYVRFLDDVFTAECARHGADSQAVRLVGLGFSQGAATITRWLARSPLLQRRPTRTQRLILWGGMFPHDMDLASQRRWLVDTDLLLVAGTRDAYATPKRIAAEQQRLHTAGISHRLIRFDGEHRLDAALLRDLAEKTTPPAS